jgi:6-phosphofructokinase
LGWKLQREIIWTHINVERAGQKGDRNETHRGIDVRRRRLGNEFGHQGRRAHGAGSRVGSLRALILGHIQRGGAPVAFDRLLVTRFGAAAVEHLARGEHGLLVVLIKGEIAATPLDEVVANRKQLDPGLFELVRAPASKG